MTKLIDNIETKTVIDRVTGKLEVTYTYKRKRCPTIKLSSKLTKSYIGYYLIENDLADIESWLNIAYSHIPKNNKNKSKDNYLITDIENDSVVKGLFMSSVAFYGKCFTQAKGRGLKLDKSFVPNEYYALHDKIMNYRHTLVAHSGKGEWDTGVLKLVLPPKKGKSISPCIKPELKRLSFIDDKEDDYRFINLVVLLKEKVRKKSNEVAKRIFSDEIKKKTEDYWYKQAKANK